MTTTNLGRIAIVPKGTWAAGSYKALDLVRYNGASYVAKSATTASPTDTTYWQLVNSDGATGAAGPTGATGATGPAGTNGTNGVDGATLYTWIKYADDASGTGLSDSPTGKSYIGIAVNKSSATESVTAADYTWSLIKGADGAGTLTSIIAGTGLSGGTITTSGTIALQNTTVTPGSYTTADITVDAQGRITAAANGAGGSSGTVTSIGMTVPSFLSVTGSPITSSGTLAISLSGTALPIANGGTGATTLAGANIDVINVASTFTGTKTFSGTSSTLAAIFANAAEVATVSATAATGTIAFYTATQSVLYYTSNASANWTINLRHSSGTTLNTAMAVGQCVTVTFLVTNGATAYYNNVVQVDGTTTGVTTKWQGGTAPTSGNTSAIDVYTYAIIKTGAATFTVLAAVSKFA